MRSCSTASRLKKQILRAICEEILKEERFAAIVGRSYRPPRDVHPIQDHVAHSIEDYTPIVRLFLNNGFKLRFQVDERPQLTSPCNTTDDDCGFHAAPRQVEARAIVCLGHQLLHSLTFGGFDYSDGTTRVSWFAPHISSMYTHWDVFADCVCEEIDKV